MLQHLILISVKNTFEVVADNTVLRLSGEIMLEIKWDAILHIDQH